MGYRDMGQEGWDTNRHLQLRGMCSSILPCKTHPQRLRQDRGYFTCASWFYSNFPISPSPEHALTQSHADHRVWANPGPASRRGEQGYGLPDLQLSPVKVLSWQPTPDGKLHPAFIYIFFQPSVAGGQENQRSKLPPHLNKQQNHCKILSCALQLHIFTYPRQQKRGALLN